MYDIEKNKMVYRKKYNKKYLKTKKRLYKH